MNQVRGRIVSVVMYTLVSPTCSKFYRGAIL